MIFLEVTHWNRDLKGLCDPCRGGRYCGENCGEVNAAGSREGCESVEGA